MRTFKLFLPLMLILSVLFISHQAKAASISGTYYVSNSGSDSNSGSELSPWRTIQHGLDVAQAGNTVLVRGGLYHENITFVRSGADGAPISLMGYPGETVVLDGTGLPLRDCFTVTRQNYLTIDGFIVKNYSVNGVGGWAFVAWDEAHHITVRNLEIANVGAPIKVAGSGGTLVRSDYTFENINAHDYPGAGIDFGPGPVKNITLRHVQITGVTTGNDTGSDAIAVENGSNILIEDTIVRGHMGDGVDCKADHVTLRRVEVHNQGRNGIKVWKGDALIENCLVEGSRAGLGALIMGGTGSYVVRNSVFLGSSGTTGTAYGYSIEAGVYGSSTTDAPTIVTLYGNTFHTEGNGGVLMNLYNNARLQAESDYNTYYSPRQDTVFNNARNTSSQTMPLVTPADINNGRYAQFITGEAHSKFDATVPAAAPAPSPSASPLPTPVPTPAPTPAPTPVTATAPTIFLASGSANAGAILTAGTGKFGSVSIVTPEALGSDKRTRLMLFATGISAGATATVASTSSAGEINTNSVVLTNLADTVTVEARTSSGQVFQLPVEFAGAQNTGSALDQVNVVLSAELQGAGNVQLTLIRNGQRSNSATVFVQ